MPDLGRVVEIRGASEGSGFLVGPGLILTAWHVVRPAAGEPFPTRVPVRILRDYERARDGDRLQVRQCDVLWPRVAPDDDNDFALLRLCEVRHDESDDAAVEWADLPDGEALEVLVVGFPGFAIFTNDVNDPQHPVQERDTAAVSGRVPAASGWKQRRVYNQGTFDIVPRQEDLPEGSHLGWEGISGAAVFAGEKLVGVVRLAAEGRPGLHRLRGLPVARLFANDEVRSALREAGVAQPPRATLTATGRASEGFSSDVLDHFGVARHAPSEFRAGVQRFLSAYLGLADQPVAFGGRDAVLDRLDRWLDDPAAPPRLLLHAPGGRGKSALVVHWLLAAAPRCQLIFLPVSVRNETNRPHLFYEALAKRLAELLVVDLNAPIVDDPVGHYRGLATDLLRRLGGGAKPVLLVIDGLDEAAGWSLPPALLPELPHAGLRVVVSARERAGAPGAQGWLRKLGWEGGKPSPETIAVEPLDVAGVADVLRSVNARFAGADGEEVSAQVARLSGGDPWVVRLYAEDLVESSGRTQRLRPEDLSSLQPGFGEFFRLWLEDQEELWRLRQRPLDRAVLDALLAILACALGPLRHEDLAEVYRRHRGEQFALPRDAIEPIDRFIQGDGRSSGYVLVHPKLADFLRDEHFADPLIPRRARGAFLRWGMDTLAALDAGTSSPAACSAYLVTYLGQHLVDAAAPVDDFMRLVEKGWLDAWHAAEGGYRGFSLDVRRAADAIEERASQDDRRWAWRLRCQLAMSSIASVGSLIPGWLVASCVEAGRLTGRQGLYWLEQGQVSETPDMGLSEIESQTARAKALVALARVWPPGGDRSEGLRDVLRVTGSLAGGWARAEALAGLIPCLAPALMDDALRIAMSIEIDERRAPAVAALVSGTSDRSRAEALRGLLVTPTFRDGSKTIGILARSLPAGLLGTIFEQAWGGDAATRIRDANTLARVLAAESNCLPEAAGTALGKAIAVDDERIRAALLKALAPGLPDALLADALGATLAIAEPAGRWTAFSALAPRLTGSLLADATRHVQAWEAPFERAQGLGAIAPQVADARQRATVVAQAMEAVDAVHDDAKMHHLLARLASSVPEEGLREAILERWLRAIGSLADERERSFALEHVVERLPPRLLAQALQMVAALRDEGARSRPFNKLAGCLPDELMARALEISKTMRRAWVRGEAIAALAPNLPEHLLPEALDAVRPIVDQGGGVALTALVPRLPDSLVGSALAMAFWIPGTDERRAAVELVVRRVPEPVLEQTLRGLGSQLADLDSRSRMEALSAHLPESLLAVVLDILQSVDLDKGGREILVAILPRLPDALLERALQMARAVQYAESRARALAAIAPRLPVGADPDQVRAEALDAAGQVESPYDRAEILAVLLPGLPEGLMGRALDAVEGIRDAEKRAEVLDRAAARLPQPLMPRAWQIARSIAAPGPRARALAALAGRFADRTERADALEEALQGFMTVGDEDRRVQAIASLVPRFAREEARAEALAEGLRLARALHDGEARILAFARLAPHGRQALRELLQTTESWRWDAAARALAACLPASGYPDLLSAVREIADQRRRLGASLALVGVLPDASRGDYLRRGFEEKDEGWLADFIRGALAYCGPDLIRDARRAARRLKYEFQRENTLKKLETYRPRNWFDRLLRRRLDADPEAKVARALAEAEAVDDLHRARALIDLAPTLAHRLASEALRIASTIRHDYWRVSALKGLAPFIPEETWSEALQIVAAIDGADIRGRAIGDVAPHLPEPLLEQALGLVEATDGHSGFAAGITGLAPRLSGPLLRRAIDSAARELKYGELRVRTLAELGARLPAGAGRDTMASDALRDAEAILEPGGRLRALRLLLPHLAAPLQERAVVDLLRAAGRLPRASLLETIPALVASVPGYQEDRSGAGVYQAVRDVGAWFP